MENGGYIKPVNMLEECGKKHCDKYFEKVICCIEK